MVAILGRAFGLLGLVVWGVLSYGATAQGQEDPLAATPVLRDGSLAPRLVGETPHAPVVLERSVTFRTQDGKSAVLEAGDYLVAISEQPPLEVRSATGDLAWKLRAKSSSHENNLVAPAAESLGGDGDVHHLVLLLPDGRAIDAAGSLTGVFERAGSTTLASASRIRMHRVQVSKTRLPTTVASTQPAPVKQPSGPDLAELEKEVARRNAVESARRAGLTRQGWQATSVPEPDLRVVNLDPSADPDQVLHQLQTTSIGSKQIFNARQIAERASNPALRDAALRGLGGSRDPEAQKALRELYPRARSDEDRGSILEELRPERPDDATGRLLTGVLGDARASAAVKRAASKSLILMDLRRADRPRTSVPSDLRNHVPGDFRSEFEAMHQRMRVPQANPVQTRELDSRFQVIKLPREQIDALKLIAPTLPRLQPGQSPYSYCRSVGSNDEVRDCSGESRFTSPNRSGHLREIVILPTGWTVDDHGAFREEVDQMILRMATDTQNAFTRRWRDRIHYTVYWLPGQTLESGNANFGAQLFDHPVRDGQGISSDHAQVASTVNQLLQQRFPSTPVSQRPQPIGVLLLFNVRGNITANAALPHLIGRPYGIARVTRDDMQSNYVPMHELAHAAIQFLDEYIEPGMESTRATDFDLLTGMVRLDASWNSWASLIGDFFYTYEIRLSEVLADNGSDNMSLRRRFPATVTTGGFTRNEYEVESGMFFGRGTFRDAGDNVMDSGSDFAYEHTPSQVGVLRQVFESPSTADRPNDRLRAAGPLNEWLPTFGSRVRLMLFDADKYHRWHPTTRYDVEIGYWELEWRICEGLIPYPCARNVWRTFTRNATPQRTSVDLRDTLVAGFAPLVIPFLCENGLGQVQSVNLCALSFNDLLNLTLPSIQWPLPYQDVEVDTPNVATQYFWRFRTRNGTANSGYTGWSSFVRAL